jgi:hypothetical protein
MNPLDILVLSDTLWCHRQEYHDNFQRDHDYRVVSTNTEEWQMMIGPDQAIVPSEPV